MVQQLVWAAPGLAPVQLGSVPIDAAASIIEDPSKLEIPYKHVALKEVHKGTNGKLIIHIQDAHANFSGQQAIAGALSELNNRYEIPIVLVEGGDRDVTLDQVKEIATKEIWQIVARKFLHDGIITGPEYLNLTSSQPLRLMGIEYTKLYEENLTSYAALVEKRDEILTYIHGIDKALTRLRNRLYPRELVSHGDLKRATEREGGNFMQHVDLLLRLAEKAQVNLIQDYPETNKLNGLREKEQRIDFGEVQAEQTKLFAEFAKRDLSSELKVYLEAAKSNRNSQMTQFVLINKIFSLARAHKIRTDPYRGLSAYRRYLNGFAELRLDVLFRELEHIEDVVYRDLLPNDDAKRIRAVERYLGLLKKAYSVQLSSHEYQMLSLNEPVFGTEKWLSYLNTKLEQLKYTEDLLTYQPLFEEANAALKAFYDVVQRRDSAFLENTNRILNKAKADKAFLIAGGYHTENLTQILRDQGYSYAVMMPIVTHETDYEKYENILLTPLKVAQENADRIKARKLASQTGSIDESLATVNQFYRLSGGNKYSPDDVVRLRTAMEAVSAYFPVTVLIEALQGARDSRKPNQPPTMSDPGTVSGSRIPAIVDETENLIFRADAQIPYESDDSEREAYVQFLASLRADVVATEVARQEGDTGRYPNARAQALAVPAQDLLDEAEQAKVLDAARLLLALHGIKLLREEIAERDTDAEWKFNTVKTVDEFLRSDPRVGDSAKKLLTIYVGFRKNYTSVATSTGQPNALGDPARLIEQILNAGLLNDEDIALHDRIGRELTNRPGPLERSLSRSAYEEAVPLAFPGIESDRAKELVDILVEADGKAWASLISSPDYQSRRRTHRFRLFYDNGYKVRGVALNPAAIRSRLISRPQLDAYNVVYQWLESNEHLRDQVDSDYGGADISTPLYMLDAKHVHIRDALPFDLEADPSDSSLDALKLAYFVQRSIEGYVASEYLWAIGNAFVPIMWEIEALGVPMEQVRVQAGADINSFSITFPWSRDGNSVNAIERTVTYTSEAFSVEESFRGVTHNNAEAIYFRKADLRSFYRINSNAPTIISFNDRVTLDGYDLQRISALGGYVPVYGVDGGVNYANIDKGVVFTKQVKADVPWKLGMQVKQTDRITGKPVGEPYEIVEIDEKEEWVRIKREGERSATKVSFGVLDMAHVIWDAEQDGSGSRASSKTNQYLPMAAPGADGGVMSDPGTVSGARTIEQAILDFTQKRSFTLIEDLDDRQPTHSEDEISRSINELNDNDPNVREKAVDTLGRIGNPRAVDPLIPILNDNLWSMRQLAAIALGRIGDPRAVDPLIPLLNDRDSLVRSHAAIALGRIGDSGAFDSLIPLLYDNDWYVRMGAAEALRRIGDPRAITLIQSLLGSTWDPQRRNTLQSAIDVLEAKKDAEVNEELSQSLRDESHLSFNQTLRENGLTRERFLSVFRTLKESVSQTDTSYALANSLDHHISYENYHIKHPLKAINRMIYLYLRLKEVGYTQETTQALKEAISDLASVYILFSRYVLSQMSTHHPDITQEEINALRAPLLIYADLLNEKTLSIEQKKPFLEKIYQAYETITADWSVDKQDNIPREIMTYVNLVQTLLDYLHTDFELSGARVSGQQVISPIVGSRLEPQSVWERTNRVTIPNIDELVAVHGKSAEQWQRVIEHYVSLIPDGIRPTVPAIFKYSGGVITRKHVERALQKVDGSYAAIGMMIDKHESDAVEWLIKKLIRTANERNLETTYLNLASVAQSMYPQAEFSRDNLYATVTVVGLDHQELGVKFKAQTAKRRSLSNWVAETSAAVAQIIAEGGIPYTDTVAARLDPPTKTHNITTIAKRYHTQRNRDFYKDTGIRVRKQYNRYSDGESSAATADSESPDGSSASDQPMSDPGTVSGARAPIYADFSGTIALHGNVPHEVSLRKLVAQDVRRGWFGLGRVLFRIHAALAYGKFTKIRRDESKGAYKDRYLTWLKPFKGRLQSKHFVELVRDWELNEDFFTAIDQLRDQLNIPHGEVINIPILSGTITQLVEAFIERKDVAERLEEANISFSVLAHPLTLDDNGYYSGDMGQVLRLTLDGSKHLPQRALIIGDDPMEEYGFEDRLLNVQTYDPQVVRARTVAALSTERLIQHNLEMLHVDKWTRDASHAKRTFRTRGLVDRDGRITSWTDSTRRSLLEKSFGTVLIFSLEMEYEGELSGMTPTEYRINEIETVAELEANSDVAMGAEDLSKYVEFAELIIQQSVDRMNASLRQGARAAEQPMSDPGTVSGARTPSREQVEVLKGALDKIHAAYNRLDPVIRQNHRIAIKAQDSAWASPLTILEGIRRTIDASTNVLDRMLTSYEGEELEYDEEEARIANDIALGIFDPTSRAHRSFKSIDDLEILINEDLSAREDIGDVVRLTREFVEAMRVFKSLMFQPLWDAAGSADDVDASAALDGLPSLGDFIDAMQQGLIDATREDVWVEHYIDEINWLATGITEFDELMRVIRIVRREHIDMAEHDLTVEDLFADIAQAISYNVNHTSIFGSNRALPRLSVEQVTQLDNLMRDIISERPSIASQRKLEKILEETMVEIIDPDGARVALEPMSDPGTVSGSGSRIQFGQDLGDLPREMLEFNEFSTLIHSNQLEGRFEKGKEFITRITEKQAGKYRFNVFNRYTVISSVLARFEEIIKGVYGFSIFRDDVALEDLAVVRGRPTLIEVLQVMRTEYAVLENELRTMSQQVEQVDFAERYQDEEADPVGYLADTRRHVPLLNVALVNFMAVQGARAAEQPMSDPGTVSGSRVHEEFVAEDVPSETVMPFMQEFLAQFLEAHPEYIDKIKTEVLFLFAWENAVRRTRAFNLESKQALKFSVDADAESGQLRIQIINPSLLELPLDLKSQRFYEVRELDIERDPYGVGGWGTQIILNSISGVINIPSTDPAQRAYVQWSDRQISENHWEVTFELVVPLSQDASGARSEASDLKSEVEQILETAAQGDTRDYLYQLLNDEGGRRDADTLNRYFSSGGTYSKNGGSAENYLKLYRQIVEETIERKKAERFLESPAKLSDQERRYVLDRVIQKMVVMKKVVDDERSRMIYGETSFARHLREFQEANSRLKRLSHIRRVMAHLIASGARSGQEILDRILANVLVMTRILNTKSNTTAEAVLGLSPQEVAGLPQGRIDTLRSKLTVALKFQSAHRATEREIADGNFDDYGLELVDFIRFQTYFNLTYLQVLSYSEFRSPPRGRAYVQRRLDIATMLVTAMRLTAMEKSGYQNSLHAHLEDISSELSTVSDELGGTELVADHPALRRILDDVLKKLKEGVSPNFSTGRSASNYPLDDPLQGMVEETIDVVEESLEILRSFDPAGARKTEPFTFIEFLDAAGLANIPADMREKVLFDLIQAKVLIQSKIPGHFVLDTEVALKMNLNADILVNQLHEQRVANQAQGADARTVGPLVRAIAVLSERQASGATLVGSRSYADKIRDMVNALPGLTEDNATRNSYLLNIYYKELFENVLPKLAILTGNIDGGQAPATHMGLPEHTPDFYTNPVAHLVEGYLEQDFASMSRVPPFYLIRMANALLDIPPDGLASPGVTGENSLARFISQIQNLRVNKYQIKLDAEAAIRRLTQTNGSRVRNEKPKDRSLPVLNIIQFLFGSELARADVWVSTNVAQPTRNVQLPQSVNVATLPGPSESLRDTRIYAMAGRKYADAVMSFSGLLLKQSRAPVNVQVVYQSRVRGEINRDDFKALHEGIVYSDRHLKMGYSEFTGLNPKDTMSDPDTYYVFVVDAKDFEEQAFQDIDRLAVVVVEAGDESFDVASTFALAAQVGMWAAEMELMEADNRGKEVSTNDALNFVNRPAVRITSRNLMRNGLEVRSAQNIVRIAGSRMGKIMKWILKSKITRNLSIQDLFERAHAFRKAIAWAA